MRHFINSAVAKTKYLLKLRDASMVHFINWESSANFVNYLFGNLSTLRKDKPSLRHCVSDVFTSCSYKKMFGIDARWIIALVATIKPVWNWSMNRLIRNSVSQTYFSFTSNKSVTTPLFGRYPYPTAVVSGSGYSIPKPLPECINPPLFKCDISINKVCSHTQIVSISHTGCHVNYA